MPAPLLDNGMLYIPSLLADGGAVKLQFALGAKVSTRHLKNEAHARVAHHHIIPHQRGQSRGAGLSSQGAQDAPRSPHTGQTDLQVVQLHWWVRLAGPRLTSGIAPLGTHTQAFLATCGVGH